MTTEQRVSGLLAEFARDAETALTAALKKKRIGVSGELLRSLSYKLYKADAEMSGKYALSFETYGRFVDMGAGRAAKIENVNTNGKLLRARKPKKWYGKTMYPMIYGPFLDKLVVYAQEKTLKDIKQSIV